MIIYLSMFNYALVYAKKYLFSGISLMIFGFLIKNFYILGIGLFFNLFIFYFFRNPKINKINNNKNYLVAPASGKIIKIQKNGKFLQIAIFIRLIDVHIQYSPYEGIIFSKQYFPGKNVESKKNLLEINIHYLVKCMNQSHVKFINLDIIKL